MTTTTRELASETWAEYFDALSRELLHAPTSIEVVGPSGPASIEAKPHRMRPHSTPAESECQPTKRAASGVIPEHWPRRASP